jgi:hypothetical protein
MGRLISVLGIHKLSNKAALRSGIRFAAKSDSLRQVHSGTTDVRLMSVSVSNGRREILSVEPR